MMKKLTLTDYLYTKAARKRMPLTGGFELSPLCNFACSMCYVRKSPQELRESPRKPLTLDQWRAIARQARDAGVLYVLLTGGEPLLWEGFWELYEDLTDMGMLVSVNTNGSLLDEEALRRFRQRPPRRVNVTLYGGNDETYRRLCGNAQFDRVDRGIRLLHGAGIPVKINCSLTPDNADDLEAISAYARRLEVQLDATSYMFPPVRRDPSMVGENRRFAPEDAAKYRLRVMELNSTPERYRAYLEQLCRGCAEPPGLDESCVDPVDGRIRCRAGKASFWITWDGQLTPCGMMTAPSLDLTRLDFADGWSALTELSDGVRLSGLCDGCPNHGMCHPCAAIAMAETGEAGGVPQYLCRMTRQLQNLAREALGNEK